MTCNFRILIAALLLPAMGFAQQMGTYSWNNLPTIATPTFKKDTFNIVTYGAVADGITLNTKSIEAAITACNKNGGGVVLVPEGLWLTGPVGLQSNVNLHLKNAATLLFTPDKTQYAIVEGSYEGKSAARNQSPIWGRNLENIAITGQGIIDGNGDVWRAVHKSQLTEGQWKNKLKSGGVVKEDGKTWYPSQQFMDASLQKKSMLLVDGKKLSDFEDIKDILRPNLLALANCKKVLLEGITFQNSAAWCLHPLMCEDLSIRNVTTKNPEYAHNGDGMDIESCKNFIIEGCTLDVGDDAICIKSGKDEEGRKRGRPSENGIVRNNIVYNGHGGFVIGSEMSGGARNIFVENCTFIGTDKGLRFKSTRGRGGVVEHIYARNIFMRDIGGEAIFFDMFYFVKFATDGERDTRPVINEGTPVFRNMVFENIVCNGAQTAIFIRGLQEMPIKDISIKNSVLTSKVGMQLIETENIKLENVTLNASKTDTLISVENGVGITLNKVQYPTATKTFLKVAGSNSKNITVSGSGLNKGPAAIVKDATFKGNVQVK